MSALPWWHPDRRKHYFGDPYSEKCSRCGKTREEVEDATQNDECLVRFGVYMELAQRHISSGEPS